METKLLPTVLQKTGKPSALKRLGRLLTFRREKPITDRSFTLVTTNKSNLLEALIETAEKLREKQDAFDNARAVYHAKYDALCQSDRRKYNALTPSARRELDELYEVHEGLAPELVGLYEKIRANFATDEMCDALEHARVELTVAPDTPDKRIFKEKVRKAARILLQYWQTIKEDKWAPEVMNYIASRKDSNPTDIDVQDVLNLRRKQAFMRALNGF